MTEDELETVQRLMKETDQELRRKLKIAGLHVAHALIAVMEDGSGVVRGNVSPPGLHEMADLLDEVADDAELVISERPN